MRFEGQQIDRYQILRLVGSGAMGEVYLAEDPRIGQQVAIKIIRAELTPYPTSPGAQEAARLFQREAKAIGKLDHPHILPLYDYGEAQLGEMSCIYLVMPYRPEGSLVNWVRRQYPNRLVPPAEVAHLVGQAAEALQHAHDHQIIHQDVKPSNFLLWARPKTPTRPDVLLADFGIARIITATANSSQAVRGTPSYMAPEQSLGAAVPASDQYALAVMAYELLAGRQPFQGNAVRLMYQHLHEAPPLPSAFNPQLAPVVDEALLTALSKRPEERFASVTAFANAVQNAVRRMELADAPTQISAQPLPKITAELPAISPSGNLLADLPTYITPLADGTALTTPAPTAASVPTEATALPQPETLDLAAGHAPTQVEAVGGTPHAGPGAAGLPPLPTAPATARRRSHRRWLLIAAALLVLLASLTAGAIYAFPGILPGHSGAATSATVTLTPASQDVQNTFTLSGVTGTPDASMQQVGVRLLSVTTPAQTKTVNASGQENIPGTHASGTFGVANCDQTNPLTLAAGSTFPNNNGGGPRSVNMVFDAPVTLPTPSTSLCASGYFPGHIQQVGSIGNLANGLFDYLSPSGPSCGLGYCTEIYINGALTGGQDPYNGPDVQQSDIDTAAQVLEMANKPDPQQVLQGQIKPNEQFVSTPQCTPNVTSDHKAGDRVAQVTVSVTFTCTGEVYDHDGAVALATQMLMDQAATDPGAGYALMGKIKATVTNATITDAKQGTVTLTVSAEGVWAYQFSAAQQQALARLIAGKSKQEAMSLLEQQPGVASAAIQLSGPGNTLPSDPSKIKITVQSPGA